MSVMKLFHTLIFASLTISSIVMSEKYNSMDEVHIPHGMAPNPNSYQVTYDDGTKSPLIRLKSRGAIGQGTFQAYEETLDGFTVKQVNGKYIYLEVDDDTGEYIETNLIAGVDDPSSAGIRKGAASRVRTTKPKP